MTKLKKIKSIKNFIMLVKFVTAIYSNLNGTEFGGRPARYGHYRWSLLSLLKMTDASFVCYCPKDEFEDLNKFFFEQNNIDRQRIEFKIFELSEHYYISLFNKYKNYENAKRGDRCIELQYMKLHWVLNEVSNCDYCYWIDAGLSHCGLIPNKYLSLTGPHNQGYYESPLFNNTFLKNLIDKTGDKFIIIGKENSRNYWSGTVNSKHFNKYDSSIHIIGGMFGGKRTIVENVIPLFEKYVYQVTEEDKYLYHEEDILTLMFRNHTELFERLHFDIWWHEDERISGANMEELCKINKSFYKILEELNEQ